MRGSKASQQTLPGSPKSPPALHSLPTCLAGLRATECLVRTQPSWASSLHEPSTAGLGTHRGQSARSPPGEKGLTDTTLSSPRSPRPGQEPYGPHGGTGLRPARIPVTHHEVPDGPVEDGAIVVLLLAELDKVFTGLRRLHNSPDASVRQGADRGRITSTTQGPDQAGGLVSCPGQTR